MLLTKKQQQAIEKTKGPCIILAGAGTGKTHTIVEKMKHLVLKKICPAEKIVCITFSNEAANSLQIRMQKALSLEDKKPIIRTFHAFSADLLREHGEKINLNTKFKILTPDEAKVIMHKNLRVPVTNCHRYIGSIGIAKDLGITIEEIEKYLEKKSIKYKNVELEKRLESLRFEIQTLYLKKNQDKKAIEKEVKEIKNLVNLRKFVNAWKAYEKIKEKSSFQDYSDLNKKALFLIQNHKDIALNYSYIIVDEFQDTNKIQLDLLFDLAPHHNITVVGDINQSIYRFRGAYYKNLEDFKEHFKIKNEEILTLDESYRSSNKILRNAHQLILNNYSIKKECFEVKNKYNHEGDKIKVFELKNAREEARKVLEIVKEKINEGLDPNEICIMFRNHQYGRIIRKLLDSENIKYYSVSKSSLLEQKSIKSVINYLTILNKLQRKEKGGEQSWWDLTYQLNIDEEDFIKISQFIKENRESENISAKLLNDLPSLELSENGKTQLKIFIERIKLILPLLSKSVAEIIKGVFHISGLILEGESKEEKEIILNLNKFLELAEEHFPFYEPDLSSFLHHLEIIKALEIEVEAPEIESNGVRLMTLHSTKGLEYDTVIITNMAQKRFPSERAASNPLIPLELYPEFKNIKEEDVEYVIYETEKAQQLFEERRLCYVAFTRAKNNLILTYAQDYNKKKHYASQFLNEIKYNSNPDVALSVDNEEKYTEPEVQLKSAQIANPKKSVRKEMSFSPSSLLLFSECQKKFEYKYIFNMPEEKTPNWEALRLGSFVHLVLEEGVKNNFKSLKEFLDLSSQLHLKEDWQSIELEEAEHLIKVFFERNREKYSEKSKTEQILFTEINGIKFVGFADRIDFLPDGIEIIDYKTGSSAVPPKNRNWQLGFYAIAAEKYGPVKKITLEMLKQDKPLEFAIDDNGNASALFSNRMEFNILEVKEEIVQEAKKVLEAMKTGFKACPIEKNCEFCNEYFYSK
jgi:DNA helicase II / ATP-dependent DNA helicase PcrA